MRELLDSKLERPIAFVDGDEERAILERYHEAHLGRFKTVRERCAWESGYDTAALVAGDLPSVERDRHAEEVARLEERCQSREEQLGKLSELYDVTQERLEDFEEREPDARLCAEWAATVALKATDVYSAARRYLCGESRGIVAQVQQENDSLRAQLREVEGERDRMQRANETLAVRMDLPASQLLMVGSELCGDGKIDPNDHRDPRWTPTLQRAAEVMRELTARRSLLPDVRACAEYIVERGVDNADGSARRILAALDSQGGEGE